MGGFLHPATLSVLRAVSSSTKPRMGVRRCAHSGPGGGRIAAPPARITLHVCSRYVLILRMSHVLTIPLAPEARPARARVLHPRREPVWREAMRGALIGLTASWAAAEVTLLLIGL
jgi:hypothetical protein